MIGLALSEKSKEDGMENLSLLVIDHKFKKDRKHNKYKEEIYGGEFQEEKKDEKWKASLRCSYKYPAIANC